MSILDDNIFSSKKEETIITPTSPTSPTSTDDKSTFLEKFVESEVGQGSLKKRIKVLRKKLKPNKNQKIMWNEVGVCPICGIHRSYPIAPHGKWRINVWFRNLTIADLPERMCVECWALDIVLQELERDEIEQKVGNFKKEKKFEMTRNEVLFWSQFYEINEREREEGELCKECQEVGYCILERTVKRLHDNCKKLNK